MRCTVILSDLTYPASEGLHEQAVENLRLLDVFCDALQIFIYCRNTEALDTFALASELSGNCSITVVPYSGSNLRRGFTNLIWGTARSTEKKIVGEIKLFNPDIVHLHMAVGAGFHRMLKEIPGVISWVDPISRGQLRLAQSKKGFRRIPHLVGGMIYYLFESLCRSRNKIWHVVSQTDLEYLLKVHPRQRSIQIPVSITDLGASQRFSGLVERGAQLSPKSDVTALVFADLRVPYLVASFELLVERCLRPLKLSGLSIQYKVLGRVRDYEKFFKLCGGLDIQFLVWVDDLAEILSSVDFVILPDQVGTGLKTRTVRVLAAGCATIGTPYAFEGMAVKTGCHAIVVSSWQEWQVEIRNLVNDPHLRRRLQQASPVPTSPFEANTVFAQWVSLYGEIAGVADS